MSQQKPKISIIVALSKNKVIGKNNKLIWHLPQDLKRFKKLTLNHVVIMGRKTFESIGKALPNRTNIVITRNKLYKTPNNKVIICDSLKKALQVGKKHEKKELFIIGGGQIYSQAIDFADKLYLTVINKKFKGDVFFPDFSKFKKVVFRKKNSFKDFTYEFLELEREEK